MFIPFTQMPPEARIWIFQADRPLAAEEIATVSARLRQFTDEWSVHGSSLKTSFNILYDQFVILAADESSQSASGCSIDSSVRVLKDLEQLLGVDFLDRSKVAFLIDGKVVSYFLRDLKEKFESNILNDATPAFNNLVNTKKGLESGWIVPAGDTWLRRYIQNPLAKVK